MNYMHKGCFDFEKSINFLNDSLNIDLQILILHRHYNGHIFIQQIYLTLNNKYCKFFRSICNYC